jgi:hypothetical protein
MTEWTFEYGCYFRICTHTARLLCVAKSHRGWAWAAMDAAHNIFADGRAKDLVAAKRAAEAARVGLH